MKKHLKVIQILFLITVCLLLLATLLRGILLPDQVYGYENRKANQFPAFSVSSFFRSDYQDKMETALGDQTVFSEQMKKTYNRAEAMLSLKTVKRVAAQQPTQYFSYNGLQIFGGDTLTFPPQALTASLRKQLDQKIDLINGLAAEHPELDFYAYYIEKDTDLDFETNQKIGYSDYIKAGLRSETCSFEVYNTKDFDQFCRNFFKTDHHWNADGSYCAYRQLLPFLGLSDAPLSQGEKFLVSEGFSGSKAMMTKSVGVWIEPFYAYRYAFPAMDIYINGSTTPADYGMQNAVDATATYGTYYGADNGEICFCTHSPEKENLLVLGESYDNAILKLLAGHFNCTYSVDLRYYEEHLGHQFDFETYLQEHEIDKVLWIGNVDFYTMEASV